MMVCERELFLEEIRASEKEILQAKGRMEEMLEAKDKVEELLAGKLDVERDN